MVDEEVLKPVKNKKQKGKNEEPTAADSKKDIPPPPVLNFTEEELASHKVSTTSYLLQLSYEICIQM